MKSVVSRSGIPVVVSVTVAAAVVAPERAQSHHSFAIYDRDTTEVVTCKLTRFIPGANAGIVACGTQLPESGCTEETGEVFLASPND